MLLEIAARSGLLPITRVQERLAAIAGVSNVACKAQDDHAAFFEIESSKGQLVRGDLARAVVDAGWDLNELRPAAISLEEIFLQLTAAEAVPPPADTGGQPEPGSAPPPDLSAAPPSDSGAPEAQA
jgi:ABC-2 type transport system ATP-binding protein